MPYTPEAYAYTPVNHVGKSGSIPVLLYERDGFSYLRFQTKSWPHSDGWGLWTTAGIWFEYIVKADPHESTVADLLGELAREATVHQQHLSNCRQRRNGHGASESKQENGQGASAPKVTQGNGVKQSPKSAKPPARQRKASGPDGHSLKPFRSIGGLTLRDFLDNR